MKINELQKSFFKLSSFQNFLLKFETNLPDVSGSFFENRKIRSWFVNFKILSSQFFVFK